MANISRSFGASTQIIGSGGSYATLSDTETMSSDVDMASSGYEGAQIFVEIDHVSTPTDYVEMNIYPSHDGSTYDDEPVYSLRFDKAIDVNSKNVIVRDFLHFKVGLVVTGGTDAHQGKAYVRPWRWQSV